VRVMNDKKVPTSPIRWLFNASLMLLGSVIALQIAVCYLRPIWPWVVGIIVLFGIVWLVVAFARWRRSRW